MLVIFNTTVIPTINIIETEIKIPNNILYTMFEINTLNIITPKNIIKIKDKTELNFNLEEIANNYTLKEIFVQEILDEMNKQNYTKEQLEKILEIGLSVL